MTDRTDQGTWAQLCEGIAGPMIAARLPRFRQFRPVDQISFCAHWTDAVLSGDAEIRSNAGSGIPSSHAIAWAQQRGVAEADLRDCYFVITEMWCNFARDLSGVARDAH